MKATCVLLFVALARLSAGHIFRRQYYPQQMDRLIVQPLEYINPAQGLYQDSESNERAQNPRYNQQTESRERYAHEKEQQWKHRKQPQIYEQQKWQEHSDEQYQQRQDKRQQYQEQQYQQRQDKQQQYQEQQYQRPQTKKQQYQQVRQSDESTSSESNSKESRRISEYAMPMYADPMDQNTRLYNIQRQPRPSYGDAISWRGVQIAASPKNDFQKEDIEKIFGDAHEIMTHVSKEIRDTYHQEYERVANTVNEDAHLNATELLAKYQYTVETHTIKTDDGYNLTLFRIPPRDETHMQRPVVFLMHGLLGSADDWLLMGPGKSLAYMLADAGYEVWLGNARGSKYSRRHASKHPAQADFWQFSNDEIALHDLPTMIDYVLKTSNQEKLYYVGYSQGTTAYFALAATRPEYNDKIIMMYALAPMAYMSNVRSPLFRMLSPMSPLHERLRKQLGHGQFQPSKELVHTVGGAMCDAEIACKNVCSNVNFVMSGFNVANMDVELVPVIMAHLPAGASVRQMNQYAQGVASHEFTKYDYGTEINRKVYGSTQPPKYEMWKVKVPVALYYSEEDWLAHPRDVERLAKELPNVRESYKVPDQHFSHMDYQFSRAAPETVYKMLIESIQKQTNVY